MDAFTDLVLLNENEKLFIHSSDVVVWMLVCHIQHSVLQSNGLVHFFPISILLKWIPTYYLMAKGKKISLWKRQSACSVMLSVLFIVCRIGKSMF